LNGLISLEEIFSESEVPEEKQEKFYIRDRSSADWAVAKAIAAEERRQELESYRKKLHDKVDAAINTEIATCETTIEKMIYLISPWARAEMNDTNKKTLALVAGTVKCRKSPDSTVIDNDSEVLEYLKKNRSGMIKTKTTESYSKADIKKLISDGEVVPGAHIEQGIERISIEPAPAQ
jgi:phage host-nuclease inhibitor protein Gam